MYIYILRNLINGKIYVGKTQKSIEHRWKTHLTDSKRSKTKLYNAINKYGAENFEMYPMEYTGKVSNERLNLREKYWIAVLEPEYNMTTGGDGGWIHDQTGKRWKVKDTSNMRGPHTITDAIKAGWLRATGANNYQSTSIIITPWGRFFTWRDAIAEANRLYQAGKRDVVRGEADLQSYCKQNKLLSPTGRRTYPGWRGRYTRDIGFSIEPRQTTELEN